MATDRPLRIVCFLFDPSVGGPTIRARMVYERMTASGHSIIVAFPREEGTACDYVRQAGIAAVKLPIRKPVPPRKIGAFIRYTLGLPFFVGRARRFLLKARADVVHVNGAFDIVPALAAKAAGVPVVWHLNDTVFGYRLSRALGQVVQAVATQIVVAAKRVGVHYGVPEARYSVLYAPVDVTRFAARDLGHHPGASVKLGLIGNWNWIKGQDRLVEVVDILRRRGMAVEARFIGKFLDSQKAYWQPIMRRIEALKLGDAIETPGFSGDIPRELAGRDILLLTSRSEACPMCVLEAMSVGVPQVVFDVGGVRELLGEGDDAAGIIVAEGDVVAMADAVQRLASDHDLYRKYALNGQSRARQLFSLETCVKGHEDVYRAAMENDE